MKNLMRRITSVVLLALVLVSFVGCQSAPNPPPGPPAKGDPPADPKGPKPPDSLPRIPELLPKGMEGRP